MSLNVLITGSNGQLGNKLKDLIFGPGPVNNRYFFTDIADLDYNGYSKLDITCREAVVNFVEVYNINVIINCAAYTNVERAEDDFDTANLLNNIAVGNLSYACAKVGAALIHLSTDYVFNGKGSTPYRVDETPDPIGVYGKTKYSGELAVMGSSCKYIIIRTAWLYSEYGNNFVKTMIKLTSTRPQIRVVDDQTGTPTYAGDLADLIFRIVEKGAIEGNEGVYHFTDEGVCTWYDFALQIAKLAGTAAPEGECVISPCTSEEFPSKVTRPTYSVLDKSLIKRRFAYVIPQWEESLRVCMKNLLPAK